MQENIDIKINIDGSDATRDINKTLSALEDLRGEIAKVGKGTKEFEDLKTKQRELAKEAFDGAKSFKEQQRAFEELQDALGGLDKNSQEFAEFVKVVGAAKDEMDFLTRSIDNAANDFAKLEAGVQIGEAIAASFAVTTGALALFGVESEKTEEIEKNLIATLTVLNGLNSVAQLIRKESLATQILTNVQTSIFTGLLGKERVARIAANVATGQATILQQALNIAMSVNPVMLLITAIAALTTAYTVFGGETEKVSEEQEKLNEKLKQTKEEFSSAYENRIKSGQELIKAELKQFEQTELLRINAIENEKTRLAEFVKFKKEMLKKEDALQIGRNAQEIKNNQDLIKAKESLINIANIRLSGESDEEVRKEIETRKKSYEVQKQTLIERNEEIKNLELKSKIELQTALKQVEIDAEKELKKIRQQFRQEALENALDLQRRELDAMQGIDDIHTQNKSAVNDERLKIDREYYNKVEGLITGSNKQKLEKEKELYIEGKKSLNEFLKIREELTRNSLENLTTLEKTYYNLLTEQRENDLKMLEKRFELENRLSLLTNKAQLLEDLVRGNILKKVGETNNLLSSQIDLTYLFQKQSQRAGESELDLINRRNRALSDLGETINMNKQAVMTVYYSNEEIIRQSEKLKTASEEEKAQILERIELKKLEGDKAIALLQREKEIIERDGKVKNDLLRKFIGADMRLEEDSLKLQLQAYNVYLESRVEALRKTTQTEIDILNSATIDALGVSKELKGAFEQEFKKGLGFAEALSVLQQDSELSTEVLKIDKMQKESIERNYWKEITRIRREATDKEQSLQNQRFELEDQIAQKALQNKILYIQAAQEAQAMASAAISDSINNQYDVEIARIDELEQRRLEAFDKQQQLEKMRNENATIADYQNLKREETIAKRRKEIEENAQAERNAAQLKQWEQQKALRMAEVVMNAATAISLITAQTGVAAPAAIPIVAAVNAAQLAIIAAEQPPIFERGGMIGGKPHEQGGTMVNAEEGEVIINRKSAKMFRGLLSQINEMGGGVSFASMDNRERAIVNNELGTNIDYKRLASLINNRPIKTYVTESDITSSQNSVRKQKIRTSF